MSEEQRAEEAADLGGLVEMVLPTFATDSGEWLSSVAIAESVWS